jgi:hypothetical protein
MTRPIKQGAYLIRLHERAEQADQYAREAADLRDEVARLQREVDLLNRTPFCDLELNRIKTLLEDLRADPELNAPTICGVLNALSRITEQGRAQAYGVAAGKVAA